MPTSDFRGNAGGDFSRFQIFRNSVVERQILFLRLLSVVSREEIKVMLQPASRWVNLFDLINNLPNKQIGLPNNLPTKPINSRLILKNELVAEIDSDDWAEVRDGTRRIVQILDKWGAYGSYYLSFSGNRSIHVHIFVDMASLPAHPDVIPYLEGQTGVLNAIKSFLLSQISKAADARIDLQLAGNHMVRMEGGFNEKSHKFCTMIEEIPEEKPVYYDILVPSSLPPKLWNISMFETPVNLILKKIFSRKNATPILYKSRGRPFEVEPLKDILKPVFKEGYRHWIVSSLSGWLKRHSIPENKALEIVRTLNPNDRTPTKTASTVRDIYRAKEGEKVPGFGKLVEVIVRERESGVIDQVTADRVIESLKRVSRKGVENGSRR